VNGGEVRGLGCCHCDRRGDGEEGWRGGSKEIGRRRRRYKVVLKVLCRVIPRKKMDGLSTDYLA